MSKITRTQLRGKPLEPYCKSANTTTHEFGKRDNRVYCYGLYQNNISGTSDDIAERLVCSSVEGKTDFLGGCSLVLLKNFYMNGGIPE